MSGGKSVSNLSRARELSRRSMRRAEESLRTLLGHPVRLTVCRVQIVSSDALFALADDPETGPTAGVQFEITGEGRGRILILFPLGMIPRLLQALLGRPVEIRSLTELELSAIQEVGNIMASSFLSELGDLLGRRLLHSVPEVHFEDVTQWMHGVLAPLRVMESALLVVQGLLEDGTDQIQGRFFVVSEVAALEPIAGETGGEREVPR